MLSLVCGSGERAAFRNAKAAWAPINRPATPLCLMDGMHEKMRAAHA
jgi:hypothetical protein